jgi:hypothetical protein
MRLGKMFLTLLLLGSFNLLADEKKSKSANNPAFDKMKALVGSWEGTAGKKVPTNARFQLMVDGFDFHPKPQRAISLS